MLKNRAIAYTSSWLNTFFLSCILATIIVFILIFLQPFEPYSTDIPFINLKLIGYGLCIIVTLLVIHFLEEYWFHKTNEKWFVFQELIILTIGFFFITILSYFYNTYIVNDLNIETNYVLQWMIEFGMPFIPIFIPLWIYLRFRFSKVVIKIAPIKNQSKIFIKGNNQNEEITFLEKDFVMAKAQSNYVDVYYLKDGELIKIMIRTTLSNLIKSIPSAQKIHRSYIVNPLKIESISGNTRKGKISITSLNETVPVSPKHFLAVKKHLQTRP